MALAVKRIPPRPVFRAHTTDPGEFPEGLSSFNITRPDFSTKSTTPNSKGGRGTFSVIFSQYRNFLSGQSSLATDCPPSHTGSVLSRSIDHLPHRMDYKTVCLSYGVTKG